MADSSLSAAKGLAQAAYFESMYASLIIPAAIPITPIVYEAQGDPAKIWDAADGWKETIDEMEKAQAKIEELSRRVAETEWEGDDRTAFEERMHDYVNQLDAAIVMAWSVAISLWVLAVVIALFIYLMFVITTLLAIMATGIAIALATVVGAPAAAQLVAQGNQFASMAYRVLSVDSKMLQYTFWGVAGIMTAFLAGNAVTQHIKGNKEVAATFVQSGKNSFDDMLKGTLAYLEQKGTAHLMGKGPTDGLGRPLTSRIAPLSNLEKIFATKGTADTLAGGPTGTSVVTAPFGETPYGSADDEAKRRGERDPGLDYVDRTQPDG